MVGEGLIFILDHSEAKAIIINHAFLNTYLEVKDQLKNIKHVIVNLRDAPSDFELPEGTISLQEVMNASEDDITVEISLNEIVILMYTAGTTGLPKAVTFWQGKLIGGYKLEYVRNAFKTLYLRGDDVLFTSLPLGHANALFITTFNAYLN